jgi:hypothetical protein
MLHIVKVNAFQNWCEMAHTLVSPAVVSPAELEGLEENLIPRLSRLDDHKLSARAEKARVFLQN